VYERVVVHESGCAQDHHPDAPCDPERLPPEPGYDPVLERLIREEEEIERRARSPHSRLALAQLIRDGLQGVPGIRHANSFGDPSGIAQAVGLLIQLEDDRNFNLTITEVGENAEADDVDQFLYDLRGKLRARIERSRRSGSSLAAAHAEAYEDVLDLLSGLRKLDLEEKRSRR